MANLAAAEAWGAVGSLPFASECQAAYAAAEARRKAQVAARAATTTPAPRPAPSAAAPAEPASLEPASLESALASEPAVAVEPASAETVLLPSPAVAEGSPEPASPLSSAAGTPALADVPEAAPPAAPSADFFAAGIAAGIADAGPAAETNEFAPPDDDPTLAAWEAAESGEEPAPMGEAWDHAGGDAAQADTAETDGASDAASMGLPAQRQRATARLFQTKQQSGTRIVVRVVGMIVCGALGIAVPLGLWALFGGGSSSRNAAPAARPAVKAPAVQTGFRDLWEKAEEADRQAAAKKGK